MIEKPAAVKITVRRSIKGELSAALVLDNKHK